MHPIEQYLKKILDRAYPEPVVQGSQWSLSEFLLEPEPHSNKYCTTL